MAMAPEQLGIGIRRHFTSAGRRTRTTRVEWERRDARIPNCKDGSDAFFQPDVEFPVALVAERHQHRRPEVLPRHARHARARVVAAPGDRPRRRHDHRLGRRGRLLRRRRTRPRRSATSSSTSSSHQRAAFNSPVWFNIGVKGVPQQASACFILAVDDTMDAILNWYREEGTIFKGGSGVGHQPVEHPLVARAAEGRRHRVAARSASCAAPTRRPARSSRAARPAAPPRWSSSTSTTPTSKSSSGARPIEERKARALRDAGFDMDLDGKDSHSIQYQNANNSVRVTDEFMQAVVDDADWDLQGGHDRRGRSRRCKARDLMRQIAEAAWECADPGMQFDTTINRWHTAPNTGRINGSNPCTRVHAPRQLGVQPGQHQPAARSSATTARFDVDGFKHTVEVDVHRAGDPRRQRRLPDRDDRRDQPRSSASSASATPTSARCSWRSGCPTTPTRAGRGPRRSPR